MWDLIVSVPDHCLSFYFTDVVIPISYLYGPIWCHYAICQGRANVIHVPLVVICKHTGSNFQLAYRNKKGPGKIDWFTILNGGERNVYIWSKFQSCLNKTLHSIARQNFGRGHYKENASLQKDNTLTHQQIAVDDNGSHFQTLFQDVFDHYQNLPLTGNITVAKKAWHIIDWWQCQLNFTFWCATAGCSVLIEDHHQAKDPVLASLYQFHVYYTSRRLLVEVHVALPGDKFSSWYNNTCDAGA